MRPILLRGRPIASVFELVGADENSLTFAFGWCLSQAPGFIEAVADTLGCGDVSDETSGYLQEFGGKNGITDVEVNDPGRHSWIFEAKVGFAPPSLAQLQKYTARLNEASDQIAAPLLVVVAKTDRKELWLRQSVPATLDGIAVQVLSWGQIIACADSAYGQSSNTGKAALRQLTAFIKKVLQMQDFESNQAFVVSLSGGFFGGGQTSFIDVVTKYQKYFHPVASGWPANPPNYMAFRWSGHLQSIHHVDHYEIITCWAPHFPGTIGEQVSPHFLYSLGPAITPPHAVRTGNIYPSGRVWAAIDLLLTAQTISEARDLTQARNA